MKKLRIVGLFLTLLMATGAYAQDIGNLIQGSKADINYLVGGYASPFIKVFGAGLNQGWYNTAAPHKFPGADLTISISLIGIPSSEKTFFVDNTKLQSLEMRTTGGVPTSAKVPTIFGSSKDTGYEYVLKLDPSTKTTVPSGIDLPIPKVPIPVANLGIGLPKGFDIKIRYVPSINIGDDGKFNMFGIGVLHDIKQWIPGVKNLPFSLSAFAGYTKLKTNFTIDASQDQTSEFDLSSTTIQGLISKKLAVLTVYAGLGMDMSKGSLAVKGSYDVDGNLSNNTVDDPVDLSVSTTSARATIGARLKLGPITFHGDYTKSTFSAITAGFGISVR
jgi:hypothetical protein